MTDIWTACAGRARPGPLDGTLVRIVESQAQVATMSLVDDLAEQALLETLLDTSKPSRPPGTEQLHYLLATPFRYPPLAHGSRFGSRFEPGIFYGSRTLPTGLAETAYYRFVFWSGMAAGPDSGRLRTQHAAMSLALSTDRGLRLQAPPFQEYEPWLRHPADYSATQRLGSALREAAIDAFEFRSARDPEGGLNLALLQPAALAGSQPRSLQPWLCETREERVAFTSPASPEVLGFARAQFLVDGQLPCPAL